MKKLILLPMLFMLLGLSTQRAMAVQVVTINGEQLAKTASRITFDGDNVIVTFTDGTNSTADMSQVTLTFTQSTAIEGTFQLLKPVGNELQIEHLANGQEVFIYDTAGKLLIKTTRHKIDLSSLKRATYILRYGGKVVKFNKK